MSYEPWPVGTKVVWFGPYDREPAGTAAVEKVYKTGHIVVRGRRFRMGGADSAHETGDGYSKASVYLMTAEMASRAALAAKRRAMKRLAEWLKSADPDTVPDDAMSALVARMKETTENQ